MYVQDGAEEPVIFKNVGNVLCRWDGAEIFSVIFDYHNI